MCCQEIPDSQTIRPARPENCFPFPGVRNTLIQGGARRGPRSSPTGAPSLLRSMTTILCIDDSDADRLALVRMLRATGFHVREAATGSEGLLLAAEKPDLILLDFNLPDADGVEICRTLKAEPATAGIPVLLISGERMRSEDRVLGLDGGADGCLTKPVAADELLAHLRALLCASRAEHALRQ